MLELVEKIVIHIQLGVSFEQNCWSYHCHQTTLVFWPKYKHIFLHLRLKHVCLLIVIVATQQRAPSKYFGLLISIETIQCDCFWLLTFDSGLSEDFTRFKTEVTAIFFFQIFTFTKIKRWAFFYGDICVYYVVI